MDRDVVVLCNHKILSAFAPYLPEYNYLFIEALMFAIPTNDGTP